MMTTFNLSITDKSTIIYGFNNFCNQSLTITPGYGKIIGPVILGLISWKIKSPCP